jgi:uncharacterized membrane protein
MGHDGYSIATLYCRCPHSEGHMKKLIVALSLAVAVIGGAVAVSSLTTATPAHACTTPSC